MTLDQAKAERIRAEALRRGQDPEKAVAAAEKPQAATPKGQPDGDPKADAQLQQRQAGLVKADRLLVGFLPFITVKELRSRWLGLEEGLTDDHLTCGEFTAKYGGGSSGGGEEQ